MQLLRELINTYEMVEPISEHVPIIQPINIVEPVVEEIVPFADFKINSRGLFYLEW